MTINWSIVKRAKAYTPGGNRINVLIAVKIAVQKNNCAVQNDWQYELPLAENYLDST